MTLSTLLALLGGSEFLTSDQLVIKDAEGNNRVITGIAREGTIQTTLPSGVAIIGPTITITIS